VDLGRYAKWARGYVEHGAGVRVRDNVADIPEPPLSDITTMQPAIGVTGFSW
jgi:hypothetical protein